MNMEINPSEYKILIVDDVMSNVLLLKVLLTNEKFAIATASNGRQALEQVEKENPDLVLLDVMMPDMSGFEVAQHLKSNPNTADIPIIFLTALNSTADIVKGFQVGANDFISKPFNKEELIIRVTHQISLVAAKRLILSKTEELQRTIAGRDKLYSVIAHDLRSPMGSIKMVLNMLSTAVMVKLGKVYSNLMVDVCASNQKLVARAVSIVCCATGVSPERARGVLDEAGFSAKTAIVMILCGVDAGEAHALLQRVDGQVSAAVLSRPDGVQTDAFVRRL